MFLQGLGHLRIVSLGVQAQEGREVGGHVRIPAVGQALGRPGGFQRLPVRQRLLPDAGQFLYVVVVAFTQQLHQGTLGVCLGLGGVHLQGRVGQRIAGQRIGGRAVAPAQFVVHEPADQIGVVLAGGRFLLQRGFQGLAEGGVEGIGNALPPVVAVAEAGKRAAHVSDARVRQLDAVHAVVAPGADGVEAPGFQPLAGARDPALCPVVAVAAVQVGVIEVVRLALQEAPVPLGAAVGGQGLSAVLLLGEAVFGHAAHGQAGELEFASAHEGLAVVTLYRVDAEREERVALRGDEDVAPAAVLQREVAGAEPAVAVAAALDAGDAAEAVQGWAVLVGGIAGAGIFLVLVLQGGQGVGELLVSLTGMQGKIGPCGFLGVAPGLGTLGFLACSQPLLGLLLGTGQTLLAFRDLAVAVQVTNVFHAVGLAAGSLHIGRGGFFQRACQLARQVVLARPVGTGVLAVGIDDAGVAGLQVIGADGGQEDLAQPDLLFGIRRRHADADLANLRGVEGLQGLALFVLQLHQQRQRPGHGVLHMHAQALHGVPVPVAFPGADHQPAGRILGLAGTEGQRHEAVTVHGAHGGGAGAVAVDGIGQHVLLLGSIGLTGVGHQLGRGHGQVAGQQQGRGDAP